jgi:hypothetical protein
MYWNPFDLAHSGRINSSSGRAAILGFILAGRLWVVGFIFFKGCWRHSCARGNNMKISKKIVSGWGFEPGTKMALTIVSVYYPPSHRGHKYYTIFGANTHSDAACNFCPDQLGCVRLPRPVRVHRLPRKLGLRAAAPIVRVECGRGVG